MIQTQLTLRQPADQQSLADDRHRMYQQIVTNDDVLIRRHSPSIDSEEQNLPDMDKHERHHNRRGRDVHRYPKPQQPMQRQQSIDAPQRNGGFNSRDQNLPLLIGRQSRRTVFELLSRLGQQRLQLLTPPHLPPQESPRQKPRVNSIAKLLFQPPIALLKNRARVISQLFPAPFEIFDEQRFAFDTRHDPRHQPVRKNTDDSRKQRQVKRDENQARQQPAGTWPGVKQQHHASNCAEVNVGQHPVTQRAGAPPVNLFPKRIRHHHRDTDKAHNPRQPTQRQPCAREHRVEAILTEHPEKNDGREYRDGSAADVPRARSWI